MHMHRVAVKLCGDAIEASNSCCATGCAAAAFCMMNVWGPKCWNLQVLPPGASQADVYEAAVSGIVDDVLGGFNGTIMAYGQVQLPCLSYTLSPQWLAVQATEVLVMGRCPAAQLWCQQRASE